MKLDYKIINTYYKNSVVQHLIECQKCGHVKEITSYNYDKAKLFCNGINCGDDYYNSFIGKRIGDYIIDSRQGNKYQLHCLKCGTKETLQLQALQNADKHSHKHGDRCFKNLPPSKIKNAIAVRLNDIKQRCYNPKNNNYPHYGARGINCEYEYAVDLYYDFYNELLEHSKKYGLKNSTFDRIDVNKNYSKDNLRVATQSIQSTNTTRKKLFIVEKDGVRVLCDNPMEFGRKYNVNGRSVGNLVRGSSKSAGGWILIKTFSANEDIEQIVKNESVTTKLITT